MSGHLIEIASFGRGGIHPPTHKTLTAHRGIEMLTPWPGEIWLPLVQHLGEPATPIVKKGDVVARGQKIAEGGESGVPIHASVPGKVRMIDKRPHPTMVTCPTIVIRHTDETEVLAFDEDPDWRSIDRDEMLARIREAGIVGLGGAAFPTWRKLALPPDTKIDTLILNGAECEPYLTADHRLMLTRPAEIIEGGAAMARLIGARRMLIGIEADKADVMGGFRDAAAATSLGSLEFDVRICEVRYPQGAERQLITALTGRVVPARALPMAVGVVVQNVATASAVYDALRFRLPLIDRVLTVTGPGIATPRNVQAPLGTLLQDIVTFCGGADEATTRIVSGGPMMGRTLPRLDLPLIKGMNGLVLLTGRGPFEDGYGPCIQCGRCLEACPLGLEPNQVSIFVEAGRTLETDPFGTRDCYECGACTYVCPAGRPLLQFMQVAKSALRRAGDLRIVT
jgi:H+/Na+-translocating ferredoxin:NAD+ oxidoreductase subunit C